MLRNQKPHAPTEPKTFTHPKTNPTRNWRIRIKHTQLVSQASTILLQRHSKFWAPLLRPLKLAPNLNPSLFHQILSEIQAHPKICFGFFEWAQKTLGFKPDSGARCRMIRILFGSGLSGLGRPILDSVVQDHPPAKIVPLLNIGDFQTVSPVLNCVVDFYCGKEMYLQSLEVYRMGKRCGFELSADNCNALLDLLGDKNELRLAWCFYGSIIRNESLGDRFDWSVIARILYRDGKFERISRILGMGMHHPEMYDLMIDGYSGRGDFGIAFDYLNESCGKGNKPSFSTYSSILDGACRYQDREVIENVMSLMVEKGQIPKSLAFDDYDSIIKKLCDTKKTFAMDFFFKRAEKIELQPATYECMLRAFLFEKGRVNDAIELYKVMLEKNIIPTENCYNELIIALCKENPSHKISNLLVDVIRRGFTSAPNELSTYVRKQCAQGRWNEAEELFDLIMDQGCLLNSSTCGSFVKRYCSSRRIDRAIALHDKIEGLKGNLDTATYNVLITALFKERRVEETIKVFDYMKACKQLNSESFSFMIRGLCGEKELRKAMKLHDEMLELGLKPDRRAYKRLISGFQ